MRERLGALRALEEEVSELRDQGGVIDDARVAKVRSLQIRQRSGPRALLRRSALTTTRWPLASWVRWTPARHRSRDEEYGLATACRDTAVLLKVHAEDASNETRFPRPPGPRGATLTAEELGALPLATVLRAIRAKHLALIVTVLGTPLALGAGLGFAWGTALQSGRVEARLKVADQDVGAAREAAGGAAKDRDACRAEVAQLKAAATGK